jgi:hypothetical protein
MPLWKRRRRGEIVLDIAWGGYYCRPDEGGFSVVRLLDLDPWAVHLTLFRRTWEVVPSLDEALAEEPLILHVPVAAGQVLEWSDAQLLGARPLTEDDLLGYRTYAEAMGADPQELAASVAAIVHNSNVPYPARLRIRPTAEGIAFEPA